MLKPFSGCKIPYQKAEAQNSVEALLGEATFSRSKEETLSGLGQNGTLYTRVQALEHYILVSPPLELTQLEADHNFAIYLFFRHQSSPKHGCPDTLGFVPISLKPPSLPFMQLLANLHC